MGDVKRYIADVATCVDVIPVESVSGAKFVLATDYATLEAENAKLRAELERRAVPDEPMKPAAVVNDHYSRDGVNDEISAFLPVGTQLYTASQLEDLRSVLAHELACYSELFAEFMAAPSAPKADDPVKQMLLEALEEILYAEIHSPISMNNAGCIKKMQGIARAAIDAARKGEEV